MIIANPLFDVVFKYLLDDEEVARLFISAILGLEVNELELKPQEVPITFPRTLMDGTFQNTITVMRIDFKAKITLHSGEQIVVLIELQKAKINSDVSRFRRYLGSQYIDKKNLIENAEKEVIGLPIISIYFLGYPLTNNPDIPIINIKRQYIDNFSQEILDKKDAFIEGLTHDSIVIQIPALKKFRRNKLEKLLNIFDDKQNQTTDLQLDDYPEEYKPIINRLFLANQDEVLKESIIQEQDLLDEYNNLINRQLKDQQTIEHEHVLRVEAEKQKENAEFALKATIQELLTLGFDLTKIAQITNKTVDEIKALIN